VTNVLADGDGADDIWTDGDMPQMGRGRPQQPQQQRQRTDAPPART
jgi:hypothetical protein